MLALDLSPDRPLTIEPGLAAVDPLTISWRALLGRGYQVQFKTDLSQNNWANLGSALTATNATMSTLDRIGPDGRRFYRVMLLP